MSRFIECRQGSQEWLQARAGLCTASEFSTACSTVGAPTEQQRKYVDAILVDCMTEKQAAEYAGYRAIPKSDIIERMLRGEDTEVMSDTALRYAHDLAFERLSGMPYGEPPKTWLLARGHELEDEARHKYKGKTGYFVREAGICVDDNLFGYSTDGLVEDLQKLDSGLLEVKAPIDSVKIARIWATDDLSEYTHQHQGGLWLTGRPWIDHVMYTPALESVGKDLYIKRIMRDEEFIDRMARRLAIFQAKVGEIMRQLSQ